MLHRITRCDPYCAAGAAFLVLAIISVLGAPRLLGDFYFPLCGARAVLAGSDPYAVCQIYFMGHSWPLNPLPTILAALPFVPFGDQAPMVMSIGFSLLLAYAIWRTGQPWRLFIFSSAVYWQALWSRQWSPLLVAVYLLPGLLPLALVKPQVGLPALVLRASRRRLAAVAAFGLLSLAVDPTWPLRFWQSSWGTYAGYIPLLVLPWGPLLLLALRRWREEKARLLLLVSAVPQHFYYDPLLLWLLPASPRQMLLLTACSWIPQAVQYGIARGVLPFIPESTFVVATLYLPALLIVLLPAARRVTAPVVGSPAHGSPHSPSPSPHQIPGPLVTGPD